MGNGLLNEVRAIAGAGGAHVSEGQEIERLFAMLAEVRQFNQVEKIRESLPELDKSLATFDLRTEPPRSLA